MRSPRFHVLAVLGLAAMALCTATVCAAPGQEVGSRALVRSLEGKHRVTIADGVRVAALFAGVTKGPESFAVAHRRLAAAGLLRPRDATEPAAVLTHGMASLLFFEALGLRGGWVTRALGVRPRYAYKELVYRGLIAENGEGAPMTGDDLLGLLKLATVYRKKGSL